MTPPSANGTRAPSAHPATEVRHVTPCPCCGHHQPIPDWAPALWSWDCPACAARIETALGDGWRGR